MNGKPTDRGLLIFAKADLEGARHFWKQTDEVYVNMALFHISQCAEKLIKFQCACNGIDYDYSHFLLKPAESLIAKGVFIPELVKDSLQTYGIWATKARYIVDQFAMRSHAEKHIICLEDWIDKIETQYMVIN